MKANINIAEERCRKAIAMIANAQEYIRDNSTFESDPEDPCKLHTYYPSKKEMLGYKNAATAVIAAYSVLKYEYKNLKSHFIRNIVKMGIDELEVEGVLDGMNQMSKMTVEETVNA